MTPPTSSSSSKTSNVSMTSSLNTTMTSQTTTLGHITNSTAAASGDGDAISSASETAITIIVVLILVVIVVIALFFILKKYEKLPWFCYRSYRKRRSSTSSSRRALDEESCGDTNSLHRPNEKLKQTTEEMFTIDDFEEADAGDREDREEYFYDEVFGQSEFEDETTKNSVRQLYTLDGSNEDNDEMLDFDFETLGIRADGFSREAAAGAGGGGGGGGKVTV